MFEAVEKVKDETTSIKTEAAKIGSATDDGTTNGTDTIFGKVALIKIEADKIGTASTGKPGKYLNRHGI